MLSILSALLVMTAPKMLEDSCEARFFADTLVRVHMGSKEGGISYCINYLGDSVDSGGNRFYRTSGGNDTVGWFSVKQWRNGSVQFPSIEYWPYRLCEVSGVSWRTWPERQDDRTEWCVYLGQQPFHVLGEVRLCKRFMTYLGTADDVMSPLQEYYVLDGIGVVAEVEAVHGAKMIEAVAVQYKNSWIGDATAVHVDSDEADTERTEFYRLTLNDRSIVIHGSPSSQIQVFDVLGRIVYWSADAAAAPSINGLPAGAYFIVIRSQHKSLVETVIVE